MARGSTLGGLGLTGPAGQSGVSIGSYKPKVTFGLSGGGGGPALSKAERRPFAEVGKMPVSLAGARIPDYTPDKPVEEKPQSFFRNIPIVGEALGPLDEVMGAIPGLPGFVGTKVVWEVAPDQNIKAELETRIRQGQMTQDQAEVYYFDRLMEKQGVPGFARNYINVATARDLPNATRVAALGLGVLDLPYQAAETVRALNDPNRLPGLLAADDLQLQNNAELIAIRDAYRTGEITSTQAVDRLVAAGFATSNPLDPGRSAIGTIAGDPLTWVTFGTAGLAGIAGRVSRGVLGTMKRTIGDDALGLVTKTVEDGFRQAGRREWGAGDIVEAIAFDPKYADTWGQIAPKLNATQRWMVEKAPIIIKAGRIIDDATNPLTILNRSHARTLSPERAGMDVADGILNAFGSRAYGGLKRAIYAEAGGNADILIRSLDEGFGRSGMQMMAQAGAEGLAKDAVATQGFNGVEGVVTTAALQKARDSGGMLSALVREHVDRVRQRWVPKRRGKEGVEEMLAEIRQQAALQLRNMSRGTLDEAGALRIVNRLDEDQLALLDFDHLGVVVKDFLDARAKADVAHAAAIDTATKAAAKRTKAGKAAKAELDRLRSMAPVHRLTFLGPRQATQQVIRDMLALVDNKTLSEAVRADRLRETIRAYDDLYEHISVDTELVGDGHLLNVLRRMLTDDFIDSMPAHIDDVTHMPDIMQAWLRHYAELGYRVAVRPDDTKAWRAVYNDANRLTSARPWVDWVDGKTVAPEMNRIREVTDYMFRGISGEMVLRGARSRFSRQMAEQMGLPEGTGNAVFSALLQEARRVQRTPRAMTEQQIVRAILDMPLPKSVRDKVVSRDVVHAWWFAHEGAAANVGLTQKFTGRVKTLEVVRGGTAVMSGISEFLYPAARFTFNPFFQLQELIETPFLLMMRGFIPLEDLRRMWSAEGRAAIREEVARSTFLMEQLAKRGDGTVLDFTQQSAMYVMGDAAMKSGMKKFGLFGRLPDIVFIKEWGVARAAGHRWTKDMDNFLRHAAPQGRASFATWLSYKGRYGDHAAAMAYAYDVIARADPDGVWARFGPEALRPAHLGKRAAISTNLLRTVGLDEQQAKDLTWREFRQRLRDPNDPLTIEHVLENLRTVGADDDYVGRAGVVLASPDENQWFAELTKLTGGNKKQAKVLRDYYQREADAMGLDLDEFMGRKWSGYPMDVALMRDTDGATHYQAIVGALRDRGYDVPDLSDPRYAEMDDYVLQRFPQLQPKPSRAEFDARIAAAEASGDVEGAAAIRQQAKTAQTAEEKKAGSYVRARAQRAVNPDTGKVRKSYGNLPREVYDAQGRLIYIFGEMTEAEWLTMAKNVLGDNQMVEFSEWYPDMRQAFLALNNGDPKAAADEMLAFGMSQMRASPYEGYIKVRRQLEMLARGQKDMPALKAERTALFGYNALPIRNVLEGGDPSSFGLGQKLYDFIDSLRGSSRRSVGVHGPNGNWEASAFDVWMKRNFGFVDSENIPGLRYLLNADEVTLTDEGYRIVVPELRNEQGEVYREATTYTVPRSELQEGAPTDAEYDFGIEFANRLKDYLNAYEGTGFLGKKDWHAWDVQAIGWFMAKRVMGDPTGSPTEAFFRYSTNVSFEAVPHPSSPMGQLYPEIDDDIWSTIENGYQVQQRIMADIEQFNIGEVVDLTGARITVRRPISGTWQNGVQVPGQVYEVIGTDETIRGVVSALAYMNHQLAVAGSRIAPGVRKTTAKSGQVWAVDWSSPGMTHAQAQQTLDYLVQQGDKSVMKGSTLVTYDDATWGVRSMYLDEVPGPSQTVSLTQFKRGLPDEDITQVDGVTTERYVVDSFYADTADDPEGFGRDHLENVRRYLGTEVADKLERVVEPRSRQFYEYAHRRAMGTKLAEWRIGRGRADPDYAARIEPYLDPRIDDDTALRRVVAAAGTGRAAGTPYFQRAPRGVYGAISFLDDGRSSLALNAGGVKDDTVVHEVLGHKFVQEYLDPSGRQMVVDLYNDAVAGGRVRGEHRESVINPTKRERQAYAEYQQQLAQYEAAVESRGPMLERLAEVNAKWEQRGKHAPTMEKDLVALERSGWDVRDEMDLLEEYTAMERGDFSDAEEFRDARQEVWDELLDSLSTKGEDEAQAIAPPVRPTEVPVPQPRTVKREVKPNVETAFTEKVHEWFVDQYTEWVRTGRSPVPSMDGVFDYYSDYIKRAARRPDLDPAVGKFIATKTRGGPLNQSRRGFGFNPDEKALFDILSSTAQQAARNADDLVHFRTQRSWLERSLNHPYFGLYPLSYMWGKVLPELVEFLAFRPFGMKAPFVLYAQMQRMVQQVALQTEYDPELAQYLEDNEPALRSIAMLVPGVPWDLPVNAPLWMRRIAEALLTQQKRVAEGATNKDGTPAQVDITKIDVPRIVGDVAGYAMNPVRGGETIMDTISGVTSVPGMIEGLTSGTYGEAPDRAGDVPALTNIDQPLPEGAEDIGPTGMRTQPIPAQGPSVQPLRQTGPPAKGFLPPEEPSSPTAEMEGYLNSAAEDITDALGGE